MSLGSAYWERTQGIPDYETFDDLVRQYWPNSGYPSLFFDKGLTIRLAYESPFSAWGLYALDIFIVKRFAGDDPPSITGSVDALTRHLQEGRESGHRFPGDAMPALVIADVIQVAIQALSGGQAVVNVIGVRNVAEGNAADAAAAVKAAWEAEDGPGEMHVTSYLLENYRAMDLSSSTGAVADVGSSFTGASDPPVSTNGACALVKWNGGTRSGASRGRLYHGPLAETSVNADGRTLDTGFHLALVDAYEQFRTELAAADFPLCVISRSTTDAYDVESHTVASILATQRRRIR